ncbi:MAG: fasciclin domain-containing protein, partial [Flavobacteriales bacterium]|nr:fasciclin domain-containing protein [Flavobacteriales bacterium]
MKSLKFLFPLLFGVLFGIQGAQAQEPDCSDTWTDAAEGSFEDGFTFAFTFADGDLTLDVELLDPKDGLVAFAQTTNPDFVETMMDNEGGQAFSLTFPDQTAGEDFNVAIKFAFAGGLVTSTTLNYEVGANCDVLGGGGGNDDGIALPITFEEDIDYGIVDFGDFNSSEIVTDPTDPSNTVVQSTKGAGGPEWAGTTVAEGIGFAEPLPFEAGSTTMTVRVWSPVADIPVRLKVENLTDAGVSVETEATVTEAEVWQTLTFDFANQAAGTAEINFASVYTKASIFFDFGTPGNDNTYFWDDVAFGDGGEPAEALELPITFEEDIDYGLVDFEGTTSEIVADPTDPENTVVQTLKGDGSPFFAGTTVAEDIGFAEALPFEEGATTMTIRVWSPTADIPVRVKVENLTDPTVSVETEATTTVAEEWETLTFDFANQAEGTAALNFGSVYTKATIFFNFGTDGQGLTYYWDDVTFGEGDITEPAEPLVLPITFEEDIEYGLADFEGANSEIVTDPTDSDNTVVQTVKGDGSPFFAGTTVGDEIGFAEPLPFEEGATTMTVRVWSPTADIPVRLKVENLTDPTVSVETEATTTVAEEWETLTFDFANQAEGTAAINFASVYTKASIFFNFGTDGQGLTYFWDDVAFGGEAPEPTTVWDIISGSPDHTTLATVLELTGLDAALQGEGPFTVFAPTDAAFAAVDPDYIDELLADPAGDLTEVLLYHVLGAAVFSGDLSDGQTAETLQGESIEVSIDGGNVFIN